jgi:hypothetical protein
VMKVTISKLDAARLQLDAAIEIYFVSENPVALHTLTAAAYNILRDIAIKEGSEYPFIKTTFISEYPESKHKMLRDFINGPENFFKHADRDPAGTITFDPELTEVLLLDACAYFRDKDVPRPRYYNIFRGWNGVPKEGLSETEQFFLLAAQRFLRSKGKLEYWNLARHHLNG